jgi:hypothetical protein
VRGGTAGRRWWDKKRRQLTRQFGCRVKICYKVDWMVRWGCTAISMGSSLFCIFVLPFSLHYVFLSFYYEVCPCKILTKIWYYAMIPDNSTFVTELQHYPNNDTRIYAPRCWWNIIYFQPSCTIYPVILNYMNDGNHAHVHSLRTCDCTLGILMSWHVTGE